jgi:hypothetical protein
MERYRDRQGMKRANGQHQNPCDMVESMAILLQETNPNMCRSWPDFLAFLLRFVGYSSALPIMNAKCSWKLTECNTVRHWMVSLSSVHMDDDDSGV